MCGIAGVMTMAGPPPGDDVLLALSGALGHRGPNAVGVYRNGQVAMTQTRLAIIDLAGGDQPLHGPNGTALIANAEIYNYRELRDEFGVDAFSTASDCEPPLMLYARDGVGFADGLRGMYAIALHDPAAGRLVLARDPFGVKPLYYAELPGGFAFASEPQALFAAGLVEPAPEPAGLGELLQMQFTTGPATPFHGVQRVQPGETVVIGGGRIVARRRRPGLPAQGPRTVDAATALDQLDAVLENSIALHQRADVPYAMFLSGGVDSSVILAMMARLNTRPVRAYTAGFAGAAAHDERDHARAVAKAAGAEHVEIEIGEADFWARLPEIVAAVDDPTADYAIVPTYLLAEEAAKDFRVVLCGEGGDELFAGYGRYRSATRAWIWGGRGMRVRGMLDDLGVLREPIAGWRDGAYAAEATAAAHGALSRLQLAQMVDCMDWLPNDLLTKLDRCLMAHGLEGRVPFLDPVVADFAFRLPDRLKVRRRTGKWLLRKWLERHFPVAGPFAHKRGFTVPVAHWIAARGGELGPLVAAQRSVAELCDPDAVARLFAKGESDKRYGFAAWTLLYAALWSQRHIVGADSAGQDVFQALDGGG